MFPSTEDTLFTYMRCEVSIAASVIVVGQGRAGVRVC